MREVGTQHRSGSDGHCCFELERSKKDATSNSEESRIIVKCKDEETRDHILKTINDQIFLITNIAGLLTEPMSAQVSAVRDPQRKISCGNPKYKRNPSSDSTSLN